jgi:hypothetical protein
VGLLLLLLRIQIIKSSSSMYGIDQQMRPPLLAFLV